MSEFLWVFPEVYFLMFEFQLQMSDVVMEDLNIIELSWNLPDIFVIIWKYILKLEVYTQIQMSEIRLSKLNII